MKNLRIISNRRPEMSAPSENRKLNGSTTSVKSTSDSYKRDQMRASMARKTKLGSQITTDNRKIAERLQQTYSFWFIMEQEIWVEFESDGSAVYEE